MLTFVIVNYVMKKISMPNNLPQLTLPLQRIIPFSNVEGEGNRTSVFLQGCQLNCLYCHNPETIPRQSDEARIVTLSDLFNEIMEACPFIRGVTFSGGEPTLHAEKLVPLFKALKKEGLSCYLDSNGFFNAKKIAPLIEVTDKFLFDIKGEGQGLTPLCFDRSNVLGKISCPDFRKNFHLLYDRAFQNLELLLTLNKVEEIRLVVIKDFFDSFKVIEHLAEMKGAKAVLLKLIRVHGKGVRDEAGITPFIPTVEEMETLTALAKSLGFNRVKTIL